MYYSWVRINWTLIIQIFGYFEAKAKSSFFPFFPYSKLFSEIQSPSFQIILIRSDLNWRCPRFDVHRLRSRSGWHSIWHTLFTFAMVDLESRSTCRLINPFVHCVDRPKAHFPGQILNAPPHPDKVCKTAGQRFLDKRPNCVSRTHPWLFPYSKNIILISVDLNFW